MKDGFIKVAVCTCDVRVADCIYNADSIIDALTSADKVGAKIFVTPELSVTGATCGDLFRQPTLIQGAVNAISRIVKASVGKKLLVFVGMPLSVQGKVYNSAVCIYNGNILGAIPKSIDLDRQFSVPSKDDVTEISLCSQTVPFGTRIIYTCDGLGELSVSSLIGDELYAVKSLSDDHVTLGATILVHLTAEAMLASRKNFRRDAICAQSRRLVCSIISANAGVGESTTDFVCGGESIIAENGNILTHTNTFENALAISEIDVSHILSMRSKNISFPTQSTDKYRIIPFKMGEVKTKLTRHFERLPFVPDCLDDRKDRFDTVLSIQAQGLKKRMECAYAKTAVIGISGGLDSCLALLVAVRAIDLLCRPRTDVVAVTMPCFGTTKRTRGNAEMLCELLGVTLRTVDIKHAVELHFADIGHDESMRNVVYENAQARERTQILMDIANQVSGLVVGTGDLSELALGWATYNGDQMSMYGVNASVPKTLVRALVHHIADTSTDSALSGVLIDIVNTPVSPELLPADNERITQETENLVGPYELHDFFLYHLLYNGFTPKKVLRLAEYVFQNEYDTETLRYWLKTFIKRFFSQQFKRSCLPDGPQTDVISLSPRGAWRMPSDAQSTLWLSDLDSDI